MGSAVAGEREVVDVLVIGAGVTGILQLYRLRENDFTVRVLEAGQGVGGVWYWNRYPGAGFDSESYTYAYFFSQELLDEWDWTERFASQPETERYLNHVVDKFELREHIELNTRVRAMRYDEAGNEWVVHADDGRTWRARYVLTAVGQFSAPQMPSNTQGLDSFTGVWHHTGLWPEEDAELVGRRVAVIGTGASGVQVIQTIAPDVKQLTVFQRTPTFCLPLRNAPISEEERAEIKATLPELYQRCRDSFAGFMYNFEMRSALEVTDAERRARYEELWQLPGFGKMLNNYYDLLSNKDANDTFADFMREKIRERIEDPAIAAKLMPVGHAAFTKRPPFETCYYETFDRDNVELVDLRETPIECYTPTGIKTTAAEYDVDVIIFATGWDAITGALTRIDIRGVGGASLAEKWADGPLTYLGLACAGFPNLFTLVGPHNGAGFCNVPRCAERNVEWVTELMRYLRDRGVERIEATPHAEKAWTEHVYETVEQTLLPETDSLYMGANTPGKARKFQLYAGGMPLYLEKCAECSDNGYRGFTLVASGRVR